MQQYQKICNSLTWKSGMHKHYLCWKFIFQQQLFSYNANKKGPRTHCTRKMALQDVASHYSAWRTFDGKLRLLLECSYHDIRTSSRYAYWPVDDSPTLPTWQYACAAIMKEWARTILHKVMHIVREVRTFWTHWTSQIIQTDSFFTFCTMESNGFSGIWSVHVVLTSEY